MDGVFTLKTVISDRMDLVLVANDVLHAAKFHSPARTFTSDFKAYAAELVKLVASCLRKRHSKTRQKLSAIIKFWQVNEIFEADDIDALTETARKALKAVQSGPVEKRVDKLPRWFGDRNASWADLPASYTLATTIKYGDQYNEWDGAEGRHGFGQRGQREYRHENELNKIRARGYSTKRPSLKIRNLLDEYFAKVDADPRPTGDTVSTEPGKEAEINHLGQLSFDDGSSNAKLKETNGYGWSIALCKIIEEKGYVSIGAGTEDELAVDDRWENDEEMRAHDGYHSRSPRRRRRSSSGSAHSRSPKRSRGRSFSRSPSYDSRDERSSSRRHERQPRYDDSYDNGHSRYRDNNKGYNQPRAPPNPYLRGPSNPLGNNENQYIPMPPQGVPAGLPGYPMQVPPFSGPMSTPPFAPPPFAGAPMAGMPGPMNFGGFPNNAFPQMGNNGYPGQFNNSPGHNSGYGSFNGGGFQGNNFNPRGGYRGNNQRGRGRGSGW